MTVRVPLPPEPLSSGHAVDGFECGEGSLDDWLKKRAWVRGIAVATDDAYDDFGNRTRGSGGT
jgi:hypothetical protein